MAYFFISIIWLYCTYIASHNNYIEIVKILLAKGADVDDKDNIVSTIYDDIIWHIMFLLLSFFG